MADEKGGKKKRASHQRLYQVKDGQVVRTHRACPKCGPGIFLAEHADRVSCGKCGHTEFKGAETATAKA